MGVLHVDEVKVGQTLGEDIQTPQGMKIASKGNQVSERHLKAFKAWGVTKVLIQGTISAEDGIEKEEVACDLGCQASIELIDHIFSKTDKSNPFIYELYEVVVKRATAQ